MRSGEPPGDLLAEVDVRIPSPVPEGLRAALEALRRPD
jgi:hypothetical protein